MNISGSSVTDPGAGISKTKQGLKFTASITITMKANINLLIEQKHVIKQHIMFLSGTEWWLYYDEDVQNITIQPAVLELMQHYPHSAPSQINTNYSCVSIHFSLQTDNDATSTYLTEDSGS